MENIKSPPKDALNSPNGSSYQAGQATKSLKFQISICLPESDRCKIVATKLVEILSTFIRTFLRGVNAHEAAKVIVIIDEDRQLTERELEIEKLECAADEIGIPLSFAPCNSDRIGLPRKGLVL